MKWMIASDIHGSAHYCELMLEAWAREKAHRLILLGDLLYHGPRNDLPREYAPKKVIQMLQGIAPAPLCVGGNCEAPVDQMVLPFPVLAEYALLPLDGRLVFLTHGHVYSPQSPPPLAQGDVLLTGHTHVPAWQDTGEFWYLNPGSVSIPKEGSAHSYMVLEERTFTWKNLEGAPYHQLSL